MRRREHRAEQRRLRGAGGVPRALPRPAEVGGRRPGEARQVRRHDREGGRARAARSHGSAVVFEAHRRMRHVTRAVYA